MQSLALFDLDNTLLAGDCDEAWQRFLCDKGLLDGEALRASNAKFYQDYTLGRLSMHDYIIFTSSLFNQIKSHNLACLQRQYIDEVVTPMIAPQAHQLVAEHRSRGDFCIIISATNNLTVSVVAELFDIDLWFATDLEIADGRYTGRIIGHPCYQHGKISKIQHWLMDNPEYSLNRAHFYSDSVNDVPLLEQVSCPVAVDPDDGLRQHASDKGWPVISLR